MSQVPTPPASRDASENPHESTPTPSNPSRPRLPMPPTETNTTRENVILRTRFAEYYWPRHFETNPVDPATFIDRVMTDYANYERDVVGEWLRSKTDLYKLYKACIQYGVKNGTRAKALEAGTYQKVIQMRFTRILIIRKRFRENQGCKRC